MTILDMALYERAKQLEMRRYDCKDKWILRLGRMHMVFEADIYGVDSQQRMRY